MERVTDERLAELIEQNEWHANATCAECGGDLEAVRPGKHQHPGNYREVCDAFRDLRARHREAVELLTMSAEEMEESCAFEGRLTSMKVGAERIRTFIAKEQSDG